MDLLGKKCVITGAASGIGLALAHKFHEAGADLVLADRSAHLLETATQSLNAHRNGSCHGIVVNLATESGNTELVNFANKKLGQIDLFFANAGIKICKGFGPACPPAPCPTAINPSQFSEAHFSAWVKFVTSQ